MREAAAEYARKQAAARPERGRCRVMTTPGDSDTETWPLWEVFVRANRGLSHVHVGSLHAPDADMALRNARDVYTRRNEGVSIWVVPGRRDHDERPGCEGRVLREPGRQELPARELLHEGRGGEAPVSKSYADHDVAPVDDNPHGDVDVDTLILAAELAGDSRRGRDPPTSPSTRSGWATTRSCSRSSSAGGSRAPPSSKRTSRSATSRSTCSATRARCCTTPARHPDAAKTTWRTGATSPSSAAPGCSSSRTATSPTRSRASCSPPLYLEALYSRLRRSRRMPPSPRSPRRPSKRSTTTATTRSSGCCAWPSALTNRAAARWSRSPTSGRTSTSCSRTSR